jgi:hypothetical protein
LKGLILEPRESFVFIRAISHYLRGPSLVARAVTGGDKKMRSIGALLFAAAFSLSCLPWITVAYVPFTSSGYDIDGGTDPICWRLASHDFTYESFDLSNFQMQEACSNGTDLDFKASNLVSSYFLASQLVELRQQHRMHLRSAHNPLFCQDQQNNIQVMYFGKSYTFEIEATANFEAIVDMEEAERYYPGQNITYVVHESYLQNPLYSTLYFRVILCDTRFIGFCSPLTVDIKPNQNDTTSFVEFLYQNISEEGVTDLQAVQRGNHLYSPWLRLPMKEVEPYKLHARATINLTLQDAVPGTFFVIGNGHLQIPLVATFPGGNSSELFVLVLVSTVEQVSVVCATILSLWLTPVL